MCTKLMLLIKFFAKIIGVIGPFILNLLYPVISDRSEVPISNKLFYTQFLFSPADTTKS